MTSLLPSIVILGTVAVFAAYLANARASPPERTEERRAAALALAVVLVIQAVHVVEEGTTGLHVRFPALFGLPPASFGAFVVVNVLALGIGAASIPALRAGRGTFFFPWFLALAGLLNLVLHPLAALAVGGYFPGLLSSPFTGAAGVLLLVRLRAATAEVRSRRC